MQQDWENLRKQMPVTDRWAYFDHAAVAPLPQPSREAINDWASDLAENGDANWTHWRGHVEEVRKTAAELLGADTDEVAIIRNTTEGVNLVAEGFPWQCGDNVVTLAGEFPTNLYPWLNLQDRGVETRQVQTDREQVSIEDIAAVCDERTRIISVSWVGYATGWRNDLAALADFAHSLGAYLFVDAIQGLGVLPLDVSQTGVDFLSADGHKWLLGPEGAGIFYLKRRHLDLLRPLGLGWNSVVQSGDFSNNDLNLRDSAGRYEGGSYNFAGIVGLEASLRLLADYGVAAISRRIRDVTERICAELTPRGARIISHRDPQRQSGIVAFQWPGEEDPRKIQRRCRDRGVILNCRSGFLRISPHAYTNEDDISQLLSALEDRG